MRFELFFMCGQCNERVNYLTLWLNMHFRAPDDALAYIYIYIHLRVGLKANPKKMISHEQLFDNAVHMKIMLEKEFQ